MKKRIDSATLEKYLKSLYPRECTKSAPFAFWKMQALIRDGETYYLPQYDCLYMIRDKHLLLYSSPDGICHIDPDELNLLDGISLPASLYDKVKDNLHGFDAHYGWCLTYDMEYRELQGNYMRYSAADFDFNNEAHYETAAKIICGGDAGNMWMTPQNVKRMTSFSAFDPSLWFFVYDNESCDNVAVSISAYSPEVRETDLDWIFVLPEHQGKGAGRFLITETIQRCRDKSDIIRVGGTEEFYRRCGFSNDTLWVWAVKPGYSFTCRAIQP